MFNAPLVLLGEGDSRCGSSACRGLNALIDEWRPDEVAIERVFLARNPDSALKLGQARGAAISAVVLRDLPVFEYAAKEVKLAVVGRGGAEKQQIQHMVGLMLNLHGKLQADAADALAVAITHANVRDGAPPRREHATGLEPQMIGRLKGVLIHKQPPWLVVDVHGVGYELEAPMSTFYDLPDVGREVSLFTHYAQKEDSVSLYGFLTEAERRLFRDVQKVSGIGARIALAVLGHLGRPVRDAGADRDVAALTRIPGIGKKTAERMVVELRDRAADFAGGAGTVLPAQRPPDPLSEAVVALQQLGYKPAEAQKMAKAAAADGDPAETIIKKALQSASLTAPTVAGQPRTMSQASSKSGHGHGAQAHGHGRIGLFGLVVGAIGVVFGGIGTSPLYTIRMAFSPHYGLVANHDTVLGVLSMVFWALMLVVTVRT